MPPIKNEVNFEAAKALVVQYQNPSVAFLQRRLRLGYGCALALMDALEAAEVVTPADEHGYRRLTPRFEKVPTEVFNAWRVFPDAEDALLEGELLDVCGAVAAMRPYSPKDITFFQELGLPRIEVNFPEVLSPETVICMGLALQHALQLPVYMSCMQAHRVEYVVEGDFLLAAGTRYPDDYFAAIRVPLLELARCWNIAVPCGDS